MDERTKVAAQRHAEREARDRQRISAAVDRARERRWSYPGKSCVEHPKYGCVIVPHGSNASAIECAAEYWGADFLEIAGNARVWPCDQSLPAVRPPGSPRAGESWEQMQQRRSREKEENQRASAAAKAARKAETQRKETEEREAYNAQDSLFDALSV